MQSVSDRPMTFASCSTKLIGIRRRTPDRGGEAGGCTASARLFVDRRNWPDTLTVFLKQVSPKL